MWYVQFELYGVKSELLVKNGSLPFSSERITDHAIGPKSCREKVWSIVHSIIFWEKPAISSYLSYSYVSSALSRRAVQPFLID